MAHFGCSYPNTAFRSIGGEGLGLSPKGSPKKQQQRHLEDGSQSEKHDKRAQRRVSSSVVLASVADVGSHIGHPQ